MNIFYLDEDPKICAQYHCDKHIIKMIIETAQLLCNAHHFFGNEAPYKKTHFNHPCSKWVRDNINNYRWLVELGLFLCEEYTKRYNKIHKTQKILEWLKENEPDIKDEEFYPPPQTMPEEYKKDDTINAYRTYYIKDKSRFAKWKTEKPWWFKE